MFVKMKNMLHPICRYAKNVYLCNVFHGIRFKVNKGWDSAEPLFLYIYLPSTRRNLSFRRHSFLQFRYFSEA